MPRPLRLEFPNAFYHVFSRGNRRETIFKDNNDYRHFETFLLYLSENCGVKIYAWCLMPNHFHFLIQTPEANISYFMRRLLTQYAQHFNRRHQLVGHVFQGRYKAILCDKDAYLLQLVRYIHLNPIKTKKKLVDRLEEWKWSSHRHYLGVEPAKPIDKNIREVMKLFSDTPERTTVLYSQYIMDGLRVGNWTDFYKVKGQKFLGEERFVERVKAMTSLSLRKRVRSLMPLRSVEELGWKVTKIFGIEEKDLRANIKTRMLSKIRKAMILIARKRYRFKSRMLAEYLNRDISAISKIVSRNENQERLKSELLQIEDYLTIPN